MKHSSLVLSFLLFFIVLFSAFSFGKKDSSDSSSQPGQAPKTDFLTIDLLLDTKKTGKGSHFNWKNSSASYKDTFDAVSGASKVHSTKNLRELALDKTSKSFLIPKGLYCLCLFAVANPETLAKDCFHIEQKDKKVVITFTHRGNDYKIESDENGEILVSDSFFIKLQEKELAEEDANSKDSDSKNPSQMPLPSQESTDKNPPSEQNSASDFKPDTPVDSISMIYKGKLNLQISENGILTVKGKLKLQENKKEVKNQQPDKTEQEAEKS